MNSKRTVLAAAVLAMGMFESAAAALDSEVIANDEAQGQLRLDMRVDGTTQFVYPSIWEEVNLHTPNGLIPGNGIVQYWAKGDISAVTVEIKDLDNQTVWTKNLSKRDTWWDTTFRTRTNAGNDAAGKSNHATTGDAWKFIDPGKSIFKAVLTLTTPKGVLSTQLGFDVRIRSVFYVKANDPGETNFQWQGKCWMWKVFGLTTGGAEARSDPALNGRQLGFVPGNKNLSSALECLTPRALFYYVTHGLVDQSTPPNILSMLRIDGGDYFGFKGPASAMGTHNGAPNIYDLSGHAESHATWADMIACYSADTGPMATCSVIESYKNSLSETVGGAGWVLGYSGVVALSTPDMVPNFNIVSDLTGAELSEIYGYAEDAAYSQLQTAGAVDAAHHTTRAWTLDHTVTNVNPPLDSAAIQNAAKQSFDAAHQGHAQYVFAVTEAEGTYYVDFASMTPAPVTLSIP